MKPRRPVWPEAANNTIWWLVGLNTYVCEFMCARVDDYIDYIAIPFVIVSMSATTAEMSFVV